MQNEMGSRSPMRKGRPRKDGHQGHGNAGHRSHGYNREDRGAGMDRVERMERGETVPSAAPAMPDTGAAAVAQPDVPMTEAPPVVAAVDANGAPVPAGTPGSTPVPTPAN